MTKAKECREKRHLSFLPPWEFQTPISSSRVPGPFLLRDPRLLINLSKNWLSQIYLANTRLWSCKTEVPPLLGKLNHNKDNQTNNTRKVDWMSYQNCQSMISLFFLINLFIFYIVVDFVIHWNETAMTVTGMEQTGSGIQKYTGWHLTRLHGFLGPIYGPGFCQDD